MISEQENRLATDISRVIMEHRMANPISDASVLGVLRIVSAVIESPIHGPKSPPPPPPDPADFWKQ
jgi:hypothetical protein